jgi:hypothetical protein
MDHQNGETKEKIQDKSPDIDHQGYDNADLTIQLDGNVTTATFDGQASAENSLVVAAPTPSPSKTSSQCLLL